MYISLSFPVSPLHCHPCPQNPFPASNRSSASLHIDSNLVQRPFVRLLTFRLYLRLLDPPSTLLYEWNAFIKRRPRTLRSRSPRCEFSFHRRIQEGISACQTSECEYTFKSEGVDIA